MTYARHDSPSSSVVRASDRCTEGSIPVGDSDFFFVLRSRNVKYSIFSYFFSELKIHHLSLFIKLIFVCISGNKEIDLNASINCKACQISLDDSISFFNRIYLLISSALGSRLVFELISGWSICSSLIFLPYLKTKMPFSGIHEKPDPILFILKALNQ